MSSWKIYTDRIRALLVEKKYAEAQRQAKEGLEKLPNQINLLTIATDVYRASGDREKSLEFSRQLISHHPDNWTGYGRAAQDLVALMRFDEAQIQIQEGLDKFPNQVNLLSIATDVYRASGDREKSLEFSIYIANMASDLPKRLALQQLNLLCKHFAPRSEGPEPFLLQRTTDFVSNIDFFLSSHDLPFSFIFAPKNACTSIKLTLTNSDEKLGGGAHGLANKHLKKDINLSKDVAILTRNPLNRFISAFLDKCEPNRDLDVWNSICERYGFNRMLRPEINDVLDALLQDDINLIDGHFRPQSAIFCNSFIVPARIFRIERIEDLVKYFESNGFKWKSFAKHSTAETSFHPTELRPSTIDKIFTLYEKDFVNYGYSFDATTKQDAPITSIQHQEFDEIIARSIKEFSSTLSKHEGIATIIRSILQDKRLLDDESTLSKIVHSFLARRLA